MDDTTRAQSQSVQPAGQQSGEQVTQTQTAQPAPQPVSVPNKELAPLAGMSEVMRPAEQKPELPKEVAEHVEHSTDEERPQLPQEVMRAGVTHAKELTIHHVEPQGTVQMPSITMQQAEIMKEKNPVENAAKWLGAFLQRQFAKIAYQKLVTKS